MAAHRNPFRDRSFRTEPADPRVRDFHRSLAEYAPTPLRSLPGLARELGLAALLVKDESPRFGLNAFKALGAVWALERIRSRGTPAGTVSAATAGNHGRAVAWAARRLGWQAVIFIPGGSAPARIERLRREGATVELVAGSYDDAVQLCAARSAERGWQVISDTGYDGYLEIPGWIAQGYSTLFAEVAEQLTGPGQPMPDLVLVQAGVGALLHAAVTHFRALPQQPILVAVEPVSAAALLASASSPRGRPTPAAGTQRTIMAGLNCREVSASAWPVVRRGVDWFLTLEDRYAELAMRRLAAPPAGDPVVEAGETGAAGLGGLLALRAAPELAGAGELLGGPPRRVLLLNTEGATDPAAYARIVNQ